MESTRTMDKNLYPEELLNKLKGYIAERVPKESEQKLPKFIFLCGKDITENRGGNRAVVEEMFKKIGRQDVICIMAEKLWDYDLDKETNLLNFEEVLAELSDGIILLLESMGTACELGAFASNDELAKKMVVFVDQIEYKERSSFISDGPIRKIRDLNNKNVLYVNLKNILWNPEVHEFLLHFSKNKKGINKHGDKVRFNSFLIEILDLISLCEPITKDELLYVYKYLKGFDKFDIVKSESGNKMKISPGFILKLLEVCDLIKMDQASSYRVNQNRYKFSGFMFHFSDVMYNEMRGKFLTIKYKRAGGRMLWQ